jgi:hypothetical protein
MVGTPVKVYGVPQANGTIQCYVLTYFTGFLNSLRTKAPPAPGNLLAAFLYVQERSKTES